MCIDQDPTIFVPHGGLKLEYGMANCQSSLKEFDMNAHLVKPNGTVNRQPFALHSFQSIDALN
jgi:hypothetical protein